MAIYIEEIYLFLAFSMNTLLNIFKYNSFIFNFELMSIKIYK